MSSDLAISVERLSKFFHLDDRPSMPYGRDIWALRHNRRGAALSELNGRLDLASVLDERVGALQFTIPTAAASRAHGPADFGATWRPGPGARTNA